MLKFEAIKSPLTIWGLYLELLRLLRVGLRLRFTGGVQNFLPRLLESRVPAGALCGFGGVCSNFLSTSSSSFMVGV